MKLRLALGLCLLALFAFGLTRRQADDTPEGCVRAFLDALNAREFNKARGLLVAGKQVPPEGDQFGRSGFGATFKLKSTKTFGEGDELVLAAEVAIEEDPSVVLNDLFHLRKVDGHWRIVTLSLGNLKYPPPSLLAALLASNNNAPAKAAASTACISNVKQLGLANVMYMNDYDDLMPPSDHWKSDIWPYCKNESIFHCPDDKRPGAISYRMSDHLSKVNATAIASPAETVMVYEGAGGYLMARHENRGSVAYADAHAKLVDPETFRKGYHGPQKSSR